MDTSVILSLLKLDLGITTNGRDEYFTKLIDGVIKEIERKGITLDVLNVDDQMLISDYSAWKYRKRQEDIPLAQNIQLRIRNRIVKERSVVNGTI